MRAAPEDINTLRNHLLYDLDTIRIENTSIDDPEESYKLLKLLKNIKDNIDERFDNLL